MTRAKMIVTVLASAAALAGGAAVAPAAAADAPKWQPAVDPAVAAAVRSAATKFLAAALAPDPAEARKLFAGTDEAWRDVERFRAATAATRKMVAAALRKFPDEPKAKEAERRLDPATVGRELEKAEPAVAGDRASFPELLTLNKVDGAWRVVDLSGHGQPKGELARLMDASAEVYNGLAAELDAGRYRSFAELEMTAADRFAAAFAKATTRPATRPSTRPAGKQ